MFCCSFLFILYKKSRVALGVASAVAVPPPWIQARGRKARDVCLAPVHCVGAKALATASTWCRCRCDMSARPRPTESAAVPSSARARRRHWGWPPARTAALRSRPSRRASCSTALPRCRRCGGCPFGAARGSLATGCGASRASAGSWPSRTTCFRQSQLRR